jgi:hypothetical protein
MEATCSSEMSSDFQWITQRYIPEDRSLKENENCRQQFPAKYQSTSTQLYGIKEHMIGLYIVTALRIRNPEEEVHSVSASERHRPRF